jgi:hypothetical protein
VIGGVLAAGEGGADPGPRGEEGGDGEDAGAHLQHTGHQQGYDQLHCSFSFSRR